MQLTSFRNSLINSLVALARRMVSSRTCPARHVEPDSQEAKATTSWAKESESIIPSKDPHRTNASKKLKSLGFRIFSLLDYESESEKRSLGIRFVSQWWPAVVVCACPTWPLRKQMRKKILGE